MMPAIGRFETDVDHVNMMLTIIILTLFVTESYSLTTQAILVANFLISKFHIWDPAWYIWYINTEIYVY